MRKIMPLASAATILGSASLAPLAAQDRGANNTPGGPMVTAAGLVFIGATSDSVLRAHDAGTGELAWSEQLDHAAMTIPISCRGADGMPANNEILIAWALPE